MVYTKNIKLSNLLIDTENPRLESVVENQNDTIRAVAESQNKKLLYLIKDILAHGLNPTDPILVMPGDKNNERFIVLEGNRRIASLKIVENPEIVRGTVGNSIYEGFKKFNIEYQNSPLNDINCVVVNSREDADHWIELKHTGENNGAGVVNWGTPERERFLKRRGVKSPPLHILDLLEMNGVISPDTKRKVGVTNFKRLLSTPYVREKLGINIVNSEVYANFPQKDVLKGLKRLVEDLASKRIKVPDIYHAGDRKKYIDSISEDLPNSSKEFEDYYLLGEEPKTTKPKKPQGGGTKKSKPSRRKRNTIIPIKGFSLSINQPRINDIYIELRGLKIAEFPNSIAILFRVFLELSVDEYINRKKLNISSQKSLGEKILEVAKYLRSQGLINQKQEKSVQLISQRNSFLGTSITTMNQYVHNQYIFPSPMDLIASWDNLEPLFDAIWNKK